MLGEVGSHGLSAVDDAEGVRGWRRDPFGRFELRWYAFGRPTSLVRLGFDEGYDPPLDFPAPARTPDPVPGDGVRWSGAAQARDLLGPTPDTLAECLPEPVAGPTSGEPEPRGPHVSTARKVQVWLAAGVMIVSLPLTASTGGFRDVGRFIILWPSISVAVVGLGALLVRLSSIVTHRAKFGDA